MSSDFNPYSEWLGLSPQTESPHYYELLGLPLNCDDERQISAAADLAITKVRAIRPGSKAGEWADLLDLVYAAKDCLKDPVRRAEYGKTLQAGKKSSSSASKPAESGAAVGANIRPLATDNLYPPGMGPRVASASHVPHAPEEATAQPAPSSNLPPMLPAQGSSDLPDPMRPVTAAAPAYAAPVAYGSAVPYGQQPPTGYLPPQPQYGQPAYGQQGYPPAAYGQPVYPAAAPYGSPMQPAGGYGQPSVPMGYAQPYAAPAQPQPGPMDPMAPVAAASGYASPGYAPPAGVPMASLAPYAAPVAGGFSSGMPEPKPEGVAPAVSSSRASVLMARRERDAQGGLLVWGSVAGILLVGVVVVAAIMTNNAGRNGNAVVAQGEHANSTPTDVSKPDHSKETKPAPEKQPSTPTPTPPKPEPKPEPKPPKVRPKPSTVPTEMPAEDEPKGMPEKPMSEKPTPDKPIPESPTTPTPTPTPTPEPPPVPTTPTTPMPLAPGELPSRSDVVNLEKEIIDAKDAIGEQNFDIAQRHLEAARKLAKLPQHKALISRLSLTADYVKQFRTAVELALKKMEGGEAFNVGTTPVGFVEFTGKKAILRVAGQNKEYPLAELPPGLALAIANLHLSGEDPVSRVVKGAYLLMHHKTKSADLAKAREFWNEAAAGGVDMQDLLLLLDEKYELVKEFDKLASAAGSVTSTKPE